MYKTAKLQCLSWAPPLKRETSTQTAGGPRGMTLEVKEFDTMKEQGTLGRSKRKSWLVGKE